MDKKEEEFTPQELNRAKALLLSELSQIEDKDSKSREYRLRHFSANDLIKAVSEETLYLGKPHILMKARMEREVIKREQYKVKMLTYLRSLPNQNTKCFGRVEPEFSPRELINEVETNTSVGRNWLDMYISDCEKGDPPQIIELLTGYSPEVSIPGGGLNWPRKLMITLLIIATIWILIFAIVVVYQIFGSAQVPTN